MFSSRLPGRLAANRVSQAVDAARRSGVPLLDLTETNPTHTGIPYPADLLLPLGDPRGLRFSPHPRGELATREVVASEQANRGSRVDADRVVLTASTSEAYSVLFKLLC